MVDLFDIVPLARNTDPDTSHAAAKRMMPLSATDRLLVLKAHYDFPLGMTDFELAKRLNRQQTSVGKRRGELRDLGYIEATTARFPAPSGSMAIVWRITALGKRFVEDLYRE